MERKIKQIITLGQIIDTRVSNIYCIVFLHVRVLQSVEYICVWITMYSLLVGGIIYVYVLESLTIYI